MGGRFNREQKQIAEYVKILLELYRAEQDNANMKVWWKPGSAEILEVLLKKVFGNCQYIDSTRKYYIKTPFGIGKQVFDIDENSKSSFLVIMDDLWSNLSNGISYHFDLLGVERQFIDDFRNDFIKKGTQTIINFPYWKMTPEWQLTSEGQKVLYRIREKAFLILIKKYKYNIEFLKILHNEYTHLKVAAITNFAKKLVNLDPENQIITRIPDPSWPQNNFIILIRAILVKFHAVFGDFSRIIICKNCENLSFETRKGKRNFCSKTCSDIYLRNEELEIRKCRDKQNRWIQYKLDQDKRLGDLHVAASRVCKFDCLECLTPVKGGECWFLRKKNREEFELLLNIHKK